MGRFDTMNLLWPPAGWNQFGSIRYSAGQALAKDIGRARIFGLQFKIDSVPLFKNETKLFRHDIAIDGWEYSILNESIEYPVLSFSIMDKFDMALLRECFIADIRSYDTHVPHTSRSANRAVSAALFIMKQIENGNVPDVNRVLRIYKIHPSQLSLYSSEKLLAGQLKQAFAETRQKDAVVEK